MTFTLSLTFVLFFFVVGAVVISIAYNGLKETSSSLPMPDVTEIGYGKERWERELSLWSGVLRRLEIQAKYPSKIPERLQQEIEQAKSKIAEAERHLG